MPERYARVADNLVADEDTIKALGLKPKRRRGDLP